MYYLYPYIKTNIGTMYYVNTWSMAGGPNNPVHSSEATEYSTIRCTAPPGVSLGESLHHPSMPCPLDRQPSFARLAALVTSHSFFQPFTNPPGHVVSSAFPLSGPAMHLAPVT